MYYKSPYEFDLKSASRRLSAEIQQINIVFRDEIIPAFRQDGAPNVLSVSDNFNAIALYDRDDLTDELRDIISQSPIVTDAYGIQRETDGAIMVFVGETYKGNLYDYIFGLQTRNELSGDGLGNFCDDFTNEFIAATKTLKLS